MADTVNMRLSISFSSVLLILAVGCSGPARNADNFSKLQPLSKKEAGTLIAGASNHIGEPYRYGGKTSRGWDCSGYVTSMYRRYLNMKLPRSTKGLLTASVGIEPKNRKPGDLIFFVIDSNKPSHVGIYIGKNNFIHASSSKGVIVSSMKEDYYRKRFAGFRRPLYIDLAQSE